MIWQAIAEEQARIIEELTKLCNDIIAQLAQYKNIEEEDRRLRELEEKEYGSDDNHTSAHSDGCFNNGNLGVL